MTPANEFRRFSLLALTNNASMSRRRGLQSEHLERCRSWGHTSTPPHGRQIVCRRPWRHSAVTGRRDMRARRELRRRTQYQQRQNKYLIWCACVDVVAAQRSCEEQLRLVLRTVKAGGGGAAMGADSGADTRTTRLANAAVHADALSATALAEVLFATVDAKVHVVRRG